jgi:hypothetical protein
MGNFALGEPKNAGNSAIDPAKPPEYDDPASDTEIVTGLWNYPK